MVGWHWPVASVERGSILLGRQQILQHAFSVTASSSANSLHGATLIRNPAKQTALAALTSSEHRTGVTPVTPNPVRGTHDNATPPSLAVTWVALACGQCRAREYIFRPPANPPTCILGSVNFVGKLRSRGDPYSEPSEASGAGGSDFTRTQHWRHASATQPSSSSFPPKPATARSPSTFRPPAPTPPTLLSRRQHQLSRSGE